jgi:transcriptional regulator with XRE-family HTH domain
MHAAAHSVMFPHAASDTSRSKEYPRAMTIAELRRIRMAKGLSLTEISRRTRIGIGYLRKIEEGDWQGLPPGFYTRAFIRAYAEAIGVDADVVLGTLAEDLPAAQAAGAPHPEPLHRGSQTTSCQLIPDARMHLLKQILERHNAMMIDAGRGASPALGPPIRAPRQLLAASIDGVMLGTLYGGVLSITAYACGVSIGQLVHASGPAVFTVLALITLLYVFMMGGIAGCTIGAMLLDVPLAEPPTTPLDLAAIGRRSVRFLRADVSAAADVVSLVAPLFNRARRAA